MQNRLQKCSVAIAVRTKPPLSNHSIKALGLQSVAACETPCQSASLRHHKCTNLVATTTRHRSKPLFASTAHLCHSLHALIFTEDTTALHHDALYPLMVADVRKTTWAATIPPRGPQTYNLNIHYAGTVVLSLPASVLLAQSASHYSCLPSKSQSTIYVAYLPLQSTHTNRATFGLAHSRISRCNGSPSSVNKTHFRLDRSVVARKN